MDTHRLRSTGSRLVARVDQARGDERVEVSVEMKRCVPGRDDAERK